MDAPRTLEARVVSMAPRLRRLVARLTQLGYRLRSPAEALPGPEPRTAEGIARIELEIGAVPLAVKLFWQHVGSVDLRGSHPEWIGCDRPDSLVVLPLSAALEELDDFLVDREERLRASFPFAIPIAPDDWHKSDVSGGMWYNVSVPAVADDPPLNDEWRATTFLDHVETAMQWGGFPGLERCPAHSWPAAELRLAGRVTE